MKTNHTTMIERADPLIYEPVLPVQVAILAPILIELLNQFRSRSTDSNLPIIA
jgi:hypothetical protein